MNTTEKKHCPYCGAIVADNMETEYGIFCEVCHNDFWFSESLPDGYEKLGYELLNQQP